MSFTSTAGALRVRVGEGGGAERPGFPPHRDALRDRRPSGQDAAERHVVPARREMDPQVVIAVAVDQPCQGGERQIEAIRRMGEERRPSFRRFDRPQIMKLYQKLVGLEEGRAGDLGGVVKTDWGARRDDGGARRQIVFPGELPVFDAYVADQREQESAGHTGVQTNGGQPCHIVLATDHRAEGLLRHRSEPLRQRRHRRDRRRQQAIELGCRTGR